MRIGAAGMVEDPVNDVNSDMEAEKSGKRDE